MPEPLDVSVRRPARRAAGGGAPAGAGDVPVHHGDHRPDPGRGAAAVVLAAGVGTPPRRLRAFCRGLLRACVWPPTSRSVTGAAAHRGGRRALPHRRTLRPGGRRRRRGASPASGGCRPGTGRGHRCPSWSWYVRTPWWAELGRDRRAADAWAASPLDALDDLVRLVTFTLVTANADAHGKHVALLHPEPGSLPSRPPTTPCPPPCGRGLRTTAAMRVAGIGPMDAITLEHLVAEPASWPHAATRARRVATATCEQLGPRHATASPGISRSPTWFPGVPRPCSTGVRRAIAELTEPAQVRDTVVIPPSGLGNRLRPAWTGGRLQVAG